MNSTGFLTKKGWWAESLWKPKLFTISSDQLIIKELVALLEGVKSNGSHLLMKVHSSIASLQDLFRLMSVLFSARLVNL